jgi:two-component system nitrate/nitrite response regulator NarL
MATEIRRSFEPIDAVIVDPDRLFREAMAGTLRSAGVRMIGLFSRVGEIDQAVLGEDLVSGRSRIVIADFPLADGIEAARWKALVARSPTVKFVYVSRQLATGDFRGAFDAGFNACLSKSLSIEAFRRCLLLLASGRSVLRPADAAPAMDYIASRTQTSTGDPVLHFTRREVSVLRHLADGASNKLIARQLGISEATVKVKVRTLLRKINVNNRTQAATWAIRNGIPERLEAAHGQD